jgi:hypothetical protein
MNYEKKNLIYAMLLCLALFQSCKKEVIEKSNPKTLKATTFKTASKDSIIVTVVGGYEILVALPEQIEIGASGAIYVSDPSDGYIKRKQANGVVDTVFSAPLEGYENPITGFALGADGTLFVSIFNNRTGWELSKKTPGGQQVIIARGIRITRLTMGSDGYLYAVVDGGIFKIAQDGQYSIIVKEDLKLFDIALGNDGLLYGMQTRKILKITQQGKVSTFAGSTESGYIDGKGTQARFGGLGALTIDDKGDIFVADITKVRKVSNSGEVTTIFSELQNNTASLAAYENSIFTLEISAIRKLTFVK